MDRIMTSLQSATNPDLPTPTLARASLTHRLYQWAVRNRLGSRLVFVLSAATMVAVIATYLTITGQLGYSEDGPDQELSLALLVLDLVLLLLLATSVVWQMVGVWSQSRHGAAGARLHVRLAMLFSLMAVAPAILVAILSGLFFNFEMKNWFSDRVRSIVTNSYAVSEAYLYEHRQVVGAEVQAMAISINRQAPRLSGSAFGFVELVQYEARLRNLAESVVFDSSGRVRADSGLFIREDLPTPDQVERARSGGVILLPSHEDRVRALVQLDGFFDLFLYASRFVDPVVQSYVQSNRGAVDEFSRMEDRRQGIQNTVTMIFVVIALMLLLAAVGGGLSLATRLGRPVSDLIAASQRVRSGDLSARVDEGSHDNEFGRLTRAFNRMTRQLESQQLEVLEANAQLDIRRRFTEAVLAGVSAGVLGLDGDARVNLPNRSAAELLGLPSERLVGRSLEESVPEMALLIRSARRYPERLVESEITIVRDGRNRTLLCRVSVEQDEERGEIKGFVVTFDDVTELLQAQRKAAWADVARRIAHEIKNPLTPIQLSAERLKRRYLPQIRDDPETFTVCTDTIVRQVGAIGRLVDEFSSFARMPTPAMAMEEMRALVDQAVFLQSSAHPQIEYVVTGENGPIMVYCDNRQIGQALTNVLQNAADAIIATEATEVGQAYDGQIEINLATSDNGLVISITDTGCGLPDMDTHRLTEPYVTRREKGTGLGLAIVKKIMEDHNGWVSLRNRDAGQGAVVELAFHERDSDPVHSARVVTSVRVDADGA